MELEVTAGDSVTPSPPTHGGASLGPLLLSKTQAGTKSVVLY